MRCSISAARQVKTGLNSIVTAILLLATIVTSIGFGSACSKDTRAFPQLMETVPISVTHFTYWDVEDLNADADLWDIFNTFKASTDASQLEQLILMLATVERSARATSSDNSGLNGPVAVFRGDFDAAYIRSQLGTYGYSRLPSSQVEVWGPTENYAYSKAVGLHDGTLYLGEASSVIQCVNVSAKDNVLSLLQDPNIRLVSDRLPDGIIVEIHRADASHGEYYTDLIAYGKSYRKASRDTLSVTAIYMFGDDPAAREAEKDIEDYSQSQYDNVQIKRDGHFLVVTSKVPITRFVRTLAF